MEGNTESKRNSEPSLGIPTLRLWGAPPRDARPILAGSLRQGYEWECEIGHFCLLTDVAPVLGQKDRSTQTMMLFEQLEALLERVGFAFDEVVRTWFFLDDILSWYTDFNRTRTRFYSERGLLGRAPASTAVGIRNDLRVALTGHLLALRPNDARTSASVATSPLQGSAFDYGSAFSRATLLSWPAGKRLYVSGTASIDHGGKTLHPGDAQRQIDETFRVVRALLEHHGFSFGDVTLATAYLPNRADVGLLRPAWRRLLDLELSFQQADICRSDLRFELELVAERKPC